MLTTSCSGLCFAQGDDVVLLSWGSYCRHPMTSGAWYDASESSSSNTDARARLRLEAKTRQIFYKYGTRSTISPGDWLIRGSGFLEDNLYLIASGSVEGVVHDVAQTDGAGPPLPILFHGFTIACVCFAFALQS